MWSVAVAIVFILGLSRGSALAQGGPPMGMGGMPDFANMDPQKMQEFFQDRLIEMMRNQLGVTNDAEWGVLEVRMRKVLKLKSEILLSSLSRNQLRGPFANLMPPPTPEASALQKAVDNKASNAEIKAALAKLVESRKRKQAELEAAQADLRQILTFRQESQLILDGLME
jgi:hypothetical protein